MRALVSRKRSGVAFGDRAATTTYPKRRTGRTQLVNKLSLGLICGMLLAIVIPMRGEEPQLAPEAIAVGGVHVTGLPDDWTHRKLVFSNPGTEDDAISNGTHDHWLRTVNDPRYIIQQLKRRSPAQGTRAAEVARLEAGPAVNGAAATRGPMPGHRLRGGWPSLNRSTPTPTAIRGLQAAIVTLGLSLTIALLLRRRWPSTLMTAISTVTLLLLVSCGSSNTSSLMPSGPTIGSDWRMDLGATTAGAGQFPAKYSFNISGPGLCSNASTPDYVVYDTSVAGAPGSQANIIAYDNIYSGCSTVSGASTTVPLVYWAYYSGTGVAETSPVLSIDGTKVAYIENAASGATLRILKWVTGQGTDYDHPNAPQNLYTNTTVGAGGNTAWSTCPAGQSCMISVAFQNGIQDAISAPFYDYLNDIAYVGDSSGNLHKFTGVFNGTPAEVSSNNWPAAVSTYVLTSPVYDSGTSGDIFVADSGGFLYSYSTAGSRVMVSSQLAITGSKGIVDGPIVDSTTELVYVFVGNDENTNTSSPPSDCLTATGCDGVFQFPAGDTTTGTGVCKATSATAWSGTNCGKESVFGVGNTSTVLYDGSFDQIYFSGTGTTGNLWSCTATGTLTQKLVYTKMSAFVPSGDVIGPTNNAINPLTSAAATCSPVTEVYGSGGTTDDYIFLGVTNDGNQSTTTCSGAGAAGACLYNFEVSTNGTSTTVPSAATAGLASPGGTSGISLDNTEASNGLAGASQIYFSTLASGSCAGNSNASAGGGTGGCAVQASQSNP